MAGFSVTTWGIKCSLRGMEIISRFARLSCGVSYTRSSIDHKKHLEVFMLWKLRSGFLSGLIEVRSRRNNITNDLTRQQSSFSFSTYAKMDPKSEIEKRYERTISALNQLQSNSQALANKTKTVENKFFSVYRFAQRAEISLDAIDRLSIIHISGTKGKGSTCAFTENILRNHGYKTGFFSSPHMVEVRERIQVSGAPISRELFCSYFWEVHDKLTDTAADNGDEMPFYFAFLTLMAFHVFIREKVDVAIMEVGIGGQYDCTNIIRKPVVCGVTSLGLDHTSILGNTIEEIAWQKGGIFKKGVPAVTVPQELSALEVLKERAAEIGCDLYLSPEFGDYELWKDENFQLGIRGRVQETNASLALQLSQIWLKTQSHDIDCRSCQPDDDIHPSSIPILSPCSVNTQTKTGLQQCRWKGRDEVIYRAGLTYYLDGAHTQESLEQCVEWFLTESGKEAERINGRVVRILIFNMTGDRDFGARLKQLKVFLSNYVDIHLSHQMCTFDHVVFCPNYLYRDSQAPDLMKMHISKDNQLNQCSIMKEVWDKELGERSEVTRAKVEDLGQLPVVAVQLENHSVLNNIPSSVMSCLSEAFYWSTQGREPLIHSDSAPSIPETLRDAKHVQILVTGSIHLVGGALKLVDPAYVKSN